MKSQNDQFPHQHYRILVADDSKMMRLIVSRALKRVGWEVEEAENGAVVIRKALANPPDLILMDIAMPVMNGLEAMRMLRSYPVLRGTPVVILSSNGQPADVQEALASGAHSLLKKPIKDDQLVSHLVDVIGSNQQRAQVRTSIEAGCVLIVDDSRLIRTMVKRVLKELECELIEAENGEEAYQLAQKHRPDLILMDINMPVLDGLDATRLIRKDPNLKNTKIIALTSNAQLKDFGAALSAGMTDYLIKPFDKNQLLERVKHHLGA